MNRPVLKVENLSLEFPHRLGGFPALEGVNFHIAPGEIVGLVGESGSGKSVTAMSVLRLLPEGTTLYRRGKILVLDRDVLTADPGQLRRMRGATASMIFQEPMNALNPTIRIGRQIMQVIRTHEKQVSKAQAEVRARQLLVEMQVQDVDRVMRSYPFELSGGLRQRVLIAMAFSCNPSLLIADEPTTALDVTVQAQVLGLLRERARERGMSVLFITHDLAVVSQLCDRAYVMYAGRIIEQGATREVLQKPLHPYTRALLQSLPEAAEPKHYLAAIPGTAVSAADRISGCSFRPRCALATNSCSQLPPLVPSRRSSQHEVACWRSEDFIQTDGGVSTAPKMMATPGDDPHAPPLLRLTDVAVRFPVGHTWLGRPRSHVHALNGVSLDIRRGETLGIVGNPGAARARFLRLSWVCSQLQPGKSCSTVATFSGNRRRP
jgi:peptide/nickel transport system ATP-binding protein